MKCILNYCGGSISLHCNFWHVTFDAWTRDIGCVARELDWELVTSKITGLMSICILHWRSFFISLFGGFSKENICVLHVFCPRCVRRRRTHPNLAVGAGWMPDWFEGFSSGRPSCCLDIMRDREWHGNKVVLRVSFDVENTSYIEFSFFQHVELRTTDNEIGQPIAIAPSCTKYNCLCKPVRLWQAVADFFKSEHRVLHILAIFFAFFGRDLSKSSCSCSCQSGKLSSDHI